MCALYLKEASNKATLTDLGCQSSPLVLLVKALHFPPHDLFLVLLMLESDVRLLLGVRLVNALSLFFYGLQTMTRNLT